MGSHPGEVVSGALAVPVALVAVVALVPAIGIAGAGIAYAVAMGVWIGLIAPAVRRRMVGAGGPGASAGMPTPATQIR